MVKRLSDNCWITSTPDGRVNAGLISTSEGVVLVDALVTPEEGKTLGLAAGNLGPLRFTLYTHHHLDHVGGSGFSREGEVLMASEAQPLLAADIEEYLVPQGLADSVRLPTMLFSHEILLDLEPQVRVMTVGGHSPGSSVVWVPQERVLYTGDLVFRHRPPFLLDACVDTWIYNLKTLAALEPSIVAPGHGPEGGPEILDEQREWFERFIPGARRIMRTADLEEAVSWAREEFGFEEKHAPMLRKVLPRFVESGF